MKLEDFTQRLNRSIAPVDDLAGAVEAMVLAVVSRLAGWAAAVPNMIMVQRSAVRIFEIDGTLGYVIAVSLELIGQSLVGHWNQVKGWNATKRKADLVANEALAFWLIVAYFVIDFVMVFALAATHYVETGQWQIFLSLAYPVIGVISTIVTNERSALFRLRKAREIAKLDARDRRRNPGAGQRRNPGTEPGYGTGETTRRKAEAILTERPGISGGQLGRELGRSASLGRRLKREWEAEHGNGRH